ncbi:CHASE3 domain-containing protein [Sinorhizobium sp. BG8]|uniref:sensor histidine kinase n=1 Tax=Sinorhizobium sp. BG8 TaxID=2613773 RepID=UPI00193D93ED|nr:CHASE3 domain-containing protein [Sinorhizobium sp. BG8]QRM54117.1 histidine kinase [Sinorhizobium sp. BG8]
MPISNIAFVRSTLIMLFTGAIALIGIVAMSLWLSNSVQTYFTDLVQIRSARSAAADLLSALQDAETGQRGYVITGEEAYLRPYEDALAALAERQRDFQQQAAPFPQYERSIPQLNALIAEKAAELRETINMVASGNTAGAVQVVRSDRGRTTMDDIRNRLGAIIADADEQLRIRVDETTSASRALQWTTVIGAIVIVGVLGGAVAVILQHVRDLNAARREVESLNSGLELRVNERTEELIRANQEIQRFAYIVTHDLRAPLVNIMGFTSELEESLKSIQAYVLADEKTPSEVDILDARRVATDDLPEAIGFIRSSTRKMDALINAILKISRDGRRELKIERVELKPLLDAAAASINHQVTEANGDVHIAGDLPAIVTDRLSLEQVFGNLFDNAVKYQHPGRAPRISVRSRNEGRSGIVVEFSDNGRGIAAEDHERIFELFRRSGQQDMPGEGIGLAHVRSMVRNLGGDISVRSEVGVGTTFVIRLPQDLGKVVRRMQA